MRASWFKAGRRALVCATAIVAVACGGGGSGGGGSPAGGDGPRAGAGADYYPLAVGDRWLYLDDGGAHSTVRVTGTQAVSGGTAMVVETTGSGLVAIEYYLRTASAVTLVPGPGSDPITAGLGPLQVLRLPIVAGDQWLLADKTLPAVEDIDGDGRADKVAVHAVATVLGFESLTTAAGSYTQVAHVQTVVTQTATLSINGQSITVTATSDDWYAPDIGPVRNLLTVSGSGSTSRTDTGITGWGLGTRRSENVAPTVVAKTPDPGSLSGGCCVALTLTFSEAIDQSGSDSSGWHITGPDGQAVAGSVRWQPDGRTAVFTPSALLVSGTYTARVTNALDLVGNPLAAEVTWQFSIDATGPAVTPVQPLANAVEVPLDAKIVFTLDEDPDPATVIAGSISVASLTENRFVDIGVSLSGRTVTVTPLAPLVTQGRYQVLVSGVADKFGNRTAGGSWGFTADPGRFAAAQTLVTTAGVSAVAVGDVDGDGRPDVVMATGFNFGSPDQYKLFVFAGQADGTLAAPKRYATAGSYNADIDTLIVADLDGQGKNAVIAASAGNAIEVFRRQSDGTLASTQTIVTGASYVVRVADMNGDGRPDLVGRPFDGAAVQIWLQGTDGSFGAPISVPVDVGGFGDMAVGDINGDGRHDIVITSMDVVPGHEIGIVLQQSDGGFASPQYRAGPTIAGVEGVAIGDINGDGRNDVVVSLVFDSSIGVMLQDAQGQLGPISSVRAATNASRLRVADIDGDGRLDVVSSSWGGWPIALNRQRSDGTLGGAETFPVADYGSDSPGILAIGDVNGDGRPDIVYGTGWLRQRSVPATPPPAPMRAGGGRAGRLGLGQLAPPGTR
ncbi:MAG: FG-GAP-like repeat-containing protein [Caldimonas sp.]